jgi:hypothetical protein
LSRPRKEEWLLYLSRNHDISLSEVALGFVPRIPEGALINVLAISGGVGGTYSLAAYTYWVRERGWRHSDWIPSRRTDLTFG